MALWKNKATGETRTGDEIPVKPYRAKYSGVCSKCSKPINRGDIIAWPRTGGNKQRYHQDCDNPRISPWSYIVEQEQACSECGYAVGTHDYTCSKAPKPAPDPQAYEAPQAIPEQFPGDKQFDMAVPEQEQASPKPASSKPDGLLDMIIEQVTSKLDETVKLKVNTAIDVIDRRVKDKLDKLSIPSITIKRPELPDVKIDNIHKQFTTVLEYLNAGEYVYLHGSPGGHKSSIGPQLAEALGVRYGYMSLSEQSPEYVVKGFTSPIDGKYYPSQFVDFYENGGLFCWEELDASNDNLRSSLNTMLENGLASLDKGLVKKSDKFYMLCNGNTCGRGAHPAFPSRTAFDAAFAARFVFLEFEYDWELCKHIALSINDQALPIVQWAHCVCEWSLANGVQLVMSPREVYKLAKNMKLTSIPSDILLAGVLRGLDIPSKEKMLANYPFPKISR